MPQSVRRRLFGKKKPKPLQQDGGSVREVGIEEQGDRGVNRDRTFGKRVRTFMRYSLIGGLRPKQEGVVMEEDMVDGFVMVEKDQDSTDVVKGEEAVPSSTATIGDGFTEAVVESDRGLLLAGTNARMVFHDGNDFVIIDPEELESPSGICVKVVKPVRAPVDGPIAVEDPPSPNDGVVELPSVHVDFTGGVGDDVVPADCKLMIAKKVTIQGFDRPRKISISPRPAMLASHNKRQLSPSFNETSIAPADAIVSGKTLAEAALRLRDAQHSWSRYCRDAYRALQESQIRFPDTQMSRKAMQAWRSEQLFRRFPDSKSVASATFGATGLEAQVRPDLTRLPLDLAKKVTAVRAALEKVLKVLDEREAIHSVKSIASVDPPREQSILGAQSGVPWYPLWEIANGEGGGLAGDSVGDDSTAGDAEERRFVVWEDPEEDGAMAGPSGLARPGEAPVTTSSSSSNRAIMGPLVLMDRVNIGSKEEVVKDKPMVEAAGRARVPLQPKELLIPGVLDRVFGPVVRANPPQADATGRYQQAKGIARRMRV